MELLHETQKYPCAEWDLLHETQKSPFVELLHKTKKNISWSYSMKCKNPLSWSETYSMKLKKPSLWRYSTKPTPLRDYFGFKEYSAVGIAPVQTRTILMDYISWINLHKHKLL